MASNYDITMRQFNGIDYDTLYPKTIPSQIDGLSNYMELQSSGLYLPQGAKSGDILDMNGHRITNVANPVNDNDAVNKSYCDNKPSYKSIASLMSGSVGTIKSATFTFNGDKYWYRTIDNYFESTFTAPSDAYVGFIANQRLVSSDTSILDSVCRMYRLQLYKGNVLVKETEPQGFGSSDGVTVMSWSSLFTDGFYLLPGETYTLRQIAAGDIRTNTKTVYMTQTFPLTENKNISCFYV